MCCTWNEEALCCCNYWNCDCCSTGWSGRGTSETCLQECNCPTNCSADLSCQSVVGSVYCVHQGNSCSSSSADLYVKTAAAAAAAVGTELYIGAQPARYDTLIFVPCRKGRLLTSFASSRSWTYPCVIPWLQLRFDYDPTDIHVGFRCDFLLHASSCDRMHSLDEIDVIGNFNPGLQGDFPHSS